MVINNYDDVKLLSTAWKCEVCAEMCYWTSECKILHNSTSVKPVVLSLCVSPLYNSNTNTATINNKPGSGTGMQWAWYTIRLEYSVTEYNGPGIQ